MRFCLLLKHSLVFLTFLCWIGLSSAQEYSNPVSFIHLQNPELESLDGVFAIAQDKQGFIWFGGKNGLRRYDGNKVDVFRHNPEDPKSIASNDVNDIYLDSKGRLWIALLSAGGLNQFDYESQSFIRYSKNPAEANSIGSADIYALAEDDKGDLWMATNDNGLNRLEHSTGEFHRYPLFLPGTPDPAVRDIAFDHLGNIWAATNGHGLYRINKNRDQFIQYSNDQDNENSLSDNRLYKVYIDRYQNIWIGTKFGGLNRFDQTKGVFIRYKNNKYGSGLIGSGMVWDIAEDIKGNLWIATDGSLNRYNKWQNNFESFSVDHSGLTTLSGKVIKMYLDESGDFWLGGQRSTINRITERGVKFEIIGHNPKLKNSLSDLVISALAQDKQSNVWVGADNGLTKVSSDGKKFDQFFQASLGLDSNTIQTLLVDKNNQMWIKTNEGLNIYNLDQNVFIEVNKELNEMISRVIIRDMIEDQKGNIWFATEGKGLILLDQTNKTISTFVDSESNTKSLSHRFVWTVFEDKDETIWVGTLWGLNKWNREDRSFQKYLFDKNKTNSLGNNSVRAIAEDKNSNLWLGTNSGLTRYNVKQEKFETFRVKDGLPDDNITSVVVDDKGYVWLTHQKGISRLDPTSISFKNYDKRHGIASNSFPGKAATLLKDNGDVLFGSVMGITAIKALDVSENTFIPKMTFTDLYIDNELIHISESGVLKKHLSLIDEIILNPEQNNFSIGFSALSYHLPELNQYQYKLVGFDDKWRIVGEQQRRASYTNLNSGSYTLLVKGSNNEGLWNETPIQLQIIILPPWWKSTWLIIIYYLVCIGAAVAAIKNWKKNDKKNILVKKRLNNIDKLKQQFISNISKEISLPINTIARLSENLLGQEHESISEKARQQILLINENSHKLEALTQDMLDFTVFNIDEKSLNLRTLYLEPIIEGVIQWFQPQAEEKLLKLYLTIEGDLPKIEADYSCIQKILFNLIDNAIKHTDHGYVDVIARQVEEYILIQIADTGNGFDRNQYDEIFSASESKENQEGSLGLSYTKKLVELHKGTIHVESTVEKGSMFVVHLPVSQTIEDSD